MLNAETMDNTTTTAISLLRYGSDEHVPSQSEIDAMVAREMNDLSIAEREQVLNDVHGVTNIPYEGSKEMDEKLMELEFKIQTQSDDTNQSAYKQALRISKDYVQNRFFRIKFLRADRFDTGKAAKRMLAFFEQKLILFGRDKLVKDITLEDLNSFDKDVLWNGDLQLLPQRDTAGRTILFHALSNEEYKHETSLLRTIYYITMAAVEDEETQRKGIVGILYNICEKLRYYSACTLLRSTKLRNALPARYVAMHYFHNDPSFMEYVNFELCHLDAHTRARTRIHHVSSMECHYKLLSFGVPLRSIPTSILGQLNTVNHSVWMKERMTHESQHQVTSPNVHDLVKSMPVDTVACLTDSQHESSSTPAKPSRPTVRPTTLDVLFGRGKMKEHPGNINLHKLIDAKRDRYEICEKWEKTILAEVIVASIKEASGRFLKIEGGEWVEVDMEVAREKVSHTFRSRRPKPAQSRKSRPTKNVATLFHK